MIEDGNIKEGQSKLAEKLHKRAIKCEWKVFILDSLWHWNYVGWISNERFFFFGVLPLMSALRGQESNMYYLTWDSLETITGI